jgi:GntR family transcriptional regulator / MocR family aminotransferase
MSEESSYGPLCAMTRHSSLPFETLTLDGGCNVAMHRQLYELLQRQILGRQLQAGTRLPPSRTLAEQLGIGRNTVLAAYDQLQAEGYLEARPGSGTWVAAVDIATAPPTRPPPLPLSRRGTLMTGYRRYFTIPGRIAFHPGYPDVSGFPFSTWARLLARHARRPERDLFGYHYATGHPLLREAIAEYLTATRGVDCQPEQVVVVTGAQAALDILARMLLDPGDLAWVEEPGYVGARSAFASAGARLAPLRVTREGWTLAPPARLRVAFVTPSCQMPLGTIMRLDERMQLLELAERHGAWIIEDDFESEYRFRGRPAGAMQGLDRSGRVIYLGTFSKILFPSLRIGFMVVPAALVEGFAEVVAGTGHAPPLLLQRTLADFIRQGYFSTHLKRSRRVAARRQQRLVALCRQHLERWMTLDEVDAGMQLVARFTMPLADREVSARAIQQGVDVEPLSDSYFADPPEHGLRLGFAGVDAEATLQGVLALRAVFETLEGERSDVRQTVPAKRRKLDLMPGPEGG